MSEQARPAPNLGSALKRLTNRDLALQFHIANTGAVIVCLNKGAFVENVNQIFEQLRRHIENTEELNIKHIGKILSSRFFSSMM